MAALTVLDGARKETLFDLQAELDSIAQAFDHLEDTGEDGAVLLVIEKYFGDLLGKRDAKIDAYCDLYRRYKAEAEIIANEAKRLSARASARANRAQRLKDRLHLFLVEHEMERVSTTLNTARRQANGGELSVLLDVEPKELPRKYQRVTIDADRSGISLALKAGKKVKGARFAERGEHLRIE